MPFLTKRHGPLAGHAVTVLAPISSTIGSCSLTLVESRMLYRMPMFCVQPSKAVCSQRAPPYWLSDAARHVLYQMSMPSAPPYGWKHDPPWAWCTTFLYRMLCPVMSLRSASLPEIGKARPVLFPDTSL